MRRFGRSIGSQAPLGQGGCTKFRQKGGQAFGADLDLVSVCCSTVVQPQTDFTRRKARPVDGIYSDDIIGMGAAGKGQQRDSEQEAELKPAG